MARNAAAFGAWSAVRSALPSSRTVRFCAPAKPEEVLAALAALSIDNKDCAAAERELLIRYDHALRLVSRFAAQDTGALLLWLREEFDWFNFLLLAKTIRSQTSAERAQRLLFLPPLARLSPPDPLKATDDSLTDAYSQLYTKKESVLVRDAMKEPFERVEKLALRLRRERLELLSRTLERSSRSLIMSYIKKCSGLPPGSNAQQLRIFSPDHPGVSLFLELADARDSIRRLCDAARRTL